MARPLSEEKRDALLRAACALIAQLGVGAPTSKIAKDAGVSEGTLFTYFPTKDDLLNVLFLALEGELAESMAGPYPVDASAHDRLFVVWSRLIDWGLKHAAARNALRQLKVSDRVTTESRLRCHSIFWTRAHSWSGVLRSIRRLTGSRSTSTPCCSSLPTSP